MAKKPATPKTVETLKHEEAKRKNIPTAEHQSVLKQEDTISQVIKYPRNTDLDPQLVWRGKDEQDWSDLVVHAPPLYIQEKVHPKALIDDLLNQTKEAKSQVEGFQTDLFADFNGMPKDVDKTEFYQHDQNWSNRMILGDSLQVMASLAEREGLRGKVQCIYLDPPYGIKFNSNFQWSTTSRDVTDGKADHITREPEQVKAFRDTWRDGIHSYLTYLRDRLTVARDLLADSGSIFVQIGDENVHRVRALMDEVFGDENFMTIINFKKKKMTLGNVSFLEEVGDYVLYYAKRREATKFRPIFRAKDWKGDVHWSYLQLEDGIRRTMNSAEKKLETELPRNSKVFMPLDLRPSGYFSTGDFVYRYDGVDFLPAKGRCWKTNFKGMERLRFSNRLYRTAEKLTYQLFFEDYPVSKITNYWDDTEGAYRAIYVVQTANEIVKRCILMATDPGDLVLDPTCGSGTTVYVAEQWGRRWITIDTSRVALALTRARIMGARYPFYLLADSREGQIKEADVTQTTPSSQPVYGNIRHGFVYERVPHITLKSITNNAEIDVIWEQWQAKLEPLRESLNAALKKNWQEWEIQRVSDPAWPDAVKKLHADWWQARISRQREIDVSIAAKADYEHLYDKPYEDSKKVRVAGPFTVESLSPHRVLGVDENDELIDPLKVRESSSDYGAKQPFSQMILENLKIAGVQQAHKEDRIDFSTLTPWPGELVCAEGRYLEGENEKRTAIFIGPEFGTVQRPDLVAAAREAGDAGFDVLITCAFNYEAHATEFEKLGRIPVLKARMNADLHMAKDLKNTGKGNLFVIFGEPDITILPDNDDRIRIKVNGVDVFDPSTGEVRSDSAEGIACWFIDTDYNEESFFVRHAYFLGANDPYSALQATLKAEIDQEAWATLKSDTSRAFDKPKSGRIAVKVINHLGDEVMKVFKA
ncbi:site-specific DNA-methyltransferase [Chloroflexota bacterium]